MQTNKGNPNDHAAAGVRAYVVFRINRLFSFF